MAESNRSGSAPLLVTISPVNSPPSTPAKSFRRPSCVDGVIPTSIIPKLRVVASAGTDPESRGGTSAGGGPSPAKSLRRGQVSPPRRPRGTQRLDGEWWDVAGQRHHQHPGRYIRRDRYAADAATDTRYRL